MTSGLKRTREEINKVLEKLDYKHVRDYWTENGIKRVVFTDSFGYKYDGDFRNLIRGVKPRIFGKENPYVLDNIALWLKINDKSFLLDKNSNYTGNHDKLFFKCLKCGEDFDMAWKNIYSQSQGCPFCSGRRVSYKNSLENLRPDLLIEWDYSKNKISPKNVSIGSNIRVWWICSKCSNSWETDIYSRATLNKSCKDCSHIISGLKNRKSNDEFLNEVYSLVEDEYSVLSKYVLANKKIKIRHNLCGHEWEIIPSAFLNGNRCPKCRFTKGEKSISIWLERNNLNFIPQYKFDNCKYKRRLPFDFYLPDYNLCIEYDSILHYEDKFDDLGEFQLVKKRDKIKTKYCKDNKIKLLRIPYWEFDNIEEILEKTLSTL